MAATPEDERKRVSEELVDEALAESFPASDPPAWTVASIGGPDREDQPPPKPSPPPD